MTAKAQRFRVFLRTAVSNKADKVPRAVSMRMISILRCRLTCYITISRACVIFWWRIYPSHHFPPHASRVQTLMRGQGAVAVPVSLDQRRDRLYLSITFITVFHPCIRFYPPNAVVGVTYIKPHSIICPTTSYHSYHIHILFTRIIIDDVPIFFTWRNQGGFTQESWLSN